MSSPFVVSNDKKCYAEMSSFLVGILVVLLFMYVMYSCGREYFGAYDRRSSTQAHFGELSHRDHSESFIEIPTFVDNAKKFFKLETPAPQSKFINYSDIKSKVEDGFDKLKELPNGLNYKSQGPSVEKFIEFDSVDKIEEVNSKDPAPIHTPETSENMLESLIR